MKTHLKLYLQVISKFFYLKNENKLTPIVDHKAKIISKFDIFIVGQEILINF